MAITLNGLSGKELSKSLIRNKQLRTEYKTLIKSLNDKLITTINEFTSCKLENNSDMYYIVSPSNYEAGSIQLTTFIRNKPYSHGTFNSIEQLIQDNQGLIISEYQVTEGVI